MTGKTVTGRVEQRRRAAVAEIVDAAWTMAAEEGLAGISMRELATRLDMRPQSLAWYFPSKNALYDAMHRAGHEEFVQRLDGAAANGPLDLRAAAHLFAAFCMEKPARYQLLTQRTVPGFVPSEASAGLARTAFGAWRHALAEVGVTEAGHVDVLTAVVKGLVDQQITVDPAGDRYLRHLDTVIGMFRAHVRPGAG
jgi:AcrR family transcriptional regulator